MKRLISLLLTMCMVLSLPCVAAVAESNEGSEIVESSIGVTLPAQFQSGNSEFKDMLESKYIDPDRVYSTDVRWWLGMASSTDETLLESIQALYDAGFRGAELCLQNETGADSATYAYGSEMWARKWKLMMNKFLDLDMTVSLTSGTHWATANVPGLDPDTQAAMQNVSMGTATVAAGESLTMLPKPSTNRSVAKLVGAYAYVQTDDWIDEHPEWVFEKSVRRYHVDPDSMIDLTDLVAEGATVWEQTLDWETVKNQPEFNETATYRVFAYWTQGTAQIATPAAETCYTINYFDVRGVEALKTFWTANYLDDEELNEKILKGDVQVFMDSLEIDGGGGITFWAENMADEFYARKGYRIEPYLFLLEGFGANDGQAFVADTYRPMPGIYRLGEDNELFREGIVNDWLDFQTDMYMERLLIPLKTWLNSKGIKTRAQISYAKPFETSKPIMALDYPETENRMMYNQVDYFRLWSGGAKLQNKVLSAEASSQGTTGYRFPIQYQLRDVYSMYASGIQRAIWHIWSADYGYSSTATVWPGTAPGGDSFFRFGTRNPYSRDYDEFNAHLGRLQQLVQTGKSRTDIGFIHNKWYQYLPNWGEGTSRSAMSVYPNTPANINKMNWQLAHQGVHYRSTELQNNGYTYDYFGPEFLFDDNVYFDETTKTIENAGYKALVIYQSWLDVKAAKKILEWAEKGLPVVILGDAASRTPFNDGKDGDLAEIIAKLKNEPTVRTAQVDNYEQYFDAVPVGYEDSVMEKLQELGVYPYAGYIEPNHQLLTQTRTDEDGNLYLYAYNYCPNTYHQYSHIEEIKTLDHGTNIQTEIKIGGKFIPYYIDAWTGKVTELGRYRYEEGNTVFPIDLDFDNVALFAFEAVEDEKVHIVSTNVESAYVSADGLVIRAVEDGYYNTQLSNGTLSTNKIEVPDVYDITDWDVTVESWTANSTEGDLRREESFSDVPVWNAATKTFDIVDITTVNRKTSTMKADINVTLPTLTTWDNIPEVGNGVSGLGRYKATFNWNASEADGAYLDLGDTLIGSMKIEINDVKVGGDVSTNLTKVKRTVGIPIDGEIPNGKDQYTGGVSWMKPFADISAYLKDGENKIVIEYSSDLTNVQFSRNFIKNTENAIFGFFNYPCERRAYGPKQARIIPFAERIIPLASGDALSTIAAIEEILKEMDASDFTPDSWDKLQNALEYAKASLADPNSPQADVDQALAELVGALTNLESNDGTISRGHLDALVVSVGLLNEDDFTASSWAAVKEALNKAGTLASNATMEAVGVVFDELSAAINVLERIQLQPEKPDKSNLTKLITMVGTMNEDNYTEDSWNDFEKALIGAQDVIDDDDATQEEIEIAYKALSEALASLVLVDADPGTPIRESLDLALEHVNSLKKSDYTDASWNVLEAALKDADDLADDATQADVNTVANKLWNAIGGLEKVDASVTVDKSKLNALIIEANALNASDYANDSWNKFKSELNNSITVLGNTKATQLQVDNALQSLQDAIDGLIKKSTGGGGTGKPSGSSSKGGSSTRDTYGAASGTANPFPSSSSTTITPNTITATSKGTGEVTVQASAWPKLSGSSFRHDTVVNGAVQVRVTISDPASITQDLKVSGYTTGANVEHIENFFGKYFDNFISVLHFDQAGLWGQEIRVAAKVDLTGMNTNNLVFYAYDRASNSYQRITAPRYTIDSNGYIHFSTQHAGSIIVSDGTLVKK